MDAVKKYGKNYSEIGEKMGISDKYILYSYAHRLK